MKNPTELYKKIEQLNLEVKKNLERKGLVVPIHQSNGTIKIGYYYVKKVPSGLYTISDVSNHILVADINLPQTAILIANKLALGKWLDKDLIMQDKKYGFAVFEEILHKSSAKKLLKKKNFEKAELIQLKASIALAKRQKYKESIISDFEKLISVR